MPRGRERSRAHVEHIEVDANRAGSKPREVSRDPQPIVEPRRVLEVAVEVHPGKPDPKPIEHLAVRHPRLAEELRLRDLEEAHVRAVEDDAGVVDVGPAHVLVDHEWPRHHDGCNLDDTHDTWKSRSRRSTRPTTAPR